jgi:predicted DNA-binding transcriptional regulator YafY
VIGFAAGSGAAFGLRRLRPASSILRWAARCTAREFEFQPNLEIVEQDDGRLIVTFEASGLVEMAWHLYKWGDAVEVIEPPVLRNIVAGYRNASIMVLP